jgi:hypothetical protein
LGACNCSCDNDYDNDNDYDKDNDNDNDYDNDNDNDKDNDNDYDNDNDKDKKDKDNDNAGSFSCIGRWQVDANVSTGAISEGPEHRVITPEKAPAEGREGNPVGPFLVRIHIEHHHLPAMGVDAPTGEIWGMFGTLKKAPWSK